MYPQETTDLGVTDDLYADYGSANYSPMRSTDAFNELVGNPAHYYHRTEPNAPDSDVYPGASDIPAAQITLPPDPSAGGKPGILKALGWSTGLSQPRSMRTLFGGATLVRPSMGAHPNEGPVGFSTFTDRREAGVAALYDQWLPSQRQIQESFTTPQSAQPDGEAEGFSYGH